MKVVVAGGSGFVGRHVVAALLEHGHQVVILDRGTRPRPDGADRVSCDLVEGDVPVSLLGGAQALVNLVGIKRALGKQTFDAAHVGVTAKLIAAAWALGARRMVHVSVVCARRDAISPYHDTKWRAEQLLHESKLDVTILRPAVIYGPGDDMVTHLVKMIRFAPLFPIVGKGTSLLQPVDVRDVAQAVAATLDRPETIGRIYDVVGPERVTLRRIVETVAQGVNLPVAIVNTPIALLRPVVALMNAITAVAPSTPAQLRMLEEGLVGDSGPAGRELGLSPRRFTTDTVGVLQEGIGSLFGLSLRLVSTSTHRRWLEGLRSAWRGSLTVTAVGLLLPLIVGLAVESVWWRMAAAAVVLTALSVMVVPLPWRSLLEPAPRHFGQGVAAAAALYAIGAVVARVLGAFPSTAAQLAELYSWRDAMPLQFGIPVVLLIVLGEEIAWRNAVTLGFAARLGPWTGVTLSAAAFALAHVSLGVPVLLVAASGAGAFWSALVVRTRSAVPALVSHMLWDLTILFVWPYSGY